MRQAQFAQAADLLRNLPDAFSERPHIEPRVGRPPGWRLAKTPWRQSRLWVEEPPQPCGLRLRPRQYRHFRPPTFCLTREEPDPDATGWHVPRALIVGVASVLLAALLRRRGLEVYAPQRASRSSHSPKGLRRVRAAHRGRLCSRRRQCQSAFHPADGITAVGPCRKLQSANAATHSIAAVCAFGPREHAGTDSRARRFLHLPLPSPHFQRRPSGAIPFATTFLWFLRRRLPLSLLSLQ